MNNNIHDQQKIPSRNLMNSTQFWDSYLTIGCGLDLSKCAFCDQWMSAQIRRILHIHDQQKIPSRN